MLVFVFREPLSVIGDGVIEPEEDGIQAGGHAGAEHIEFEGGLVKGGVYEVEGGDQGGAGGEGVGLVSCGRGSGAGGGHGSGPGGFRAGFGGGYGAPGSLVAGLGSGGCAADSGGG